MSGQRGLLPGSSSHFKVSSSQNHSILVCGERAGCHWTKADALLWQLAVKSYLLIRSNVVLTALHWLWL